MEKKVIIKALCIKLMLVFSICVSADTYKVLCVSKGIIKINGQQAVKGLLFNDHDMIQWTSDNQGMRVLNINTSKVITLLAKRFSQDDSHSIADNVGHIKHLSTRELSTNETIDNTLYLLDSLMVESGPYYGNNVKEYYYYYIEDHKVEGEIKRTPDRKFFIITRNMFQGLYPSSLTISIYGEDPKQKWVYPIYSDLQIVLLQL